MQAMPTHTSLPHSLPAVHAWPMGFLQVLLASWQSPLMHSVSAVQLSPIIFPDEGHPRRNNVKARAELRI
jgi:hypothetical protein